MKDYSQNKEERQNFILNYEVNGDTIIVNFANKERHIIPNTKRNLEKLEKQMEHQVENAESNRFVANKELQLLGMHGLALVLDILIVIALGAVLNISTAIEFLASIIGSSIVVGIPSIILITKENNKLRDFLKNNMFRNNRKSINKGLTNKNVLSNCSERIQTVAEQQGPNLTFNSLDEIEYGDLTSVMSYATREEYFNFDEFTEVQSKPKARVRRKNEEVK